MRRLLPPPTGPADQAELPPAPAGADVLATHYAYPGESSARPWVRANMVTTLDGAADFGGGSKPISGAPDMRVFGVLRALADVVLVGAGTVRAEGYRPGRARAEFAAARAARGQAPAPAIAVVTAGADLDYGAPLFTAPVVPTLLLTTSAAPAEALRNAAEAGAVVLPLGAGPEVQPAAALRALADRGLRRLLLEGGPDLLGRFLAADLVDELCLTVSPCLTDGSASRIARGPELATPHPMRLAGLLEEDGFLFTRYLRER
jgi:riboflavin biosynthesis pyrimidine reductase